MINIESPNVERFLDILERITKVLEATASSYNDTQEKYAKIAAARQASEKDN